MLEIAPHLISALFDLLGTPDEVTAAADREVIMPGGARAFRRWRIRTTAGRTAADININLAPGFSEKTICVHGLFGSAIVDLDANTCAIDRRTSLSADLDRYARSRSLARQIRSQARKTLWNALRSKFRRTRAGNPYQTTFRESIAAFYGAIRSGAVLDSRIDASSGRTAIECCTKIIQAADLKPVVLPPMRRRSATAASPTVLVLGGSGFIGRELIRQLLAGGYVVRAMVRNSGAVLEEFDGDRLEITRGDLRNEAALKASLQGIEFVYHLALAEAKTWDDYVLNEVEPARLIGEACLAAGVRRLIYTGTIASYYTGAKAAVITEETPLDPHIGRRNYYSRAKAAAETILMEIHRTKRLPVVVFRPGIVIGKGGNPFHWGVGMFSENICDVWGDGTNTLPFVLVTDVASALVRGIQVAGIEGRSYNLIDVPLLTAQDYLKELQQRAGITLTEHYRPIWQFYFSDLTKWIVKLAVRHPDRNRIPSYFDWDSRTQKAFFDCGRARAELGWTPASDRERMIDEGIGGSLQSWLAASQ